MRGRFTEYAKGSVRVQITGADVERFLTSGAAKGAVYRDIDRIDVDIVQVTVGLEGYFILRGMCRRAMCQMRVCKKRGLPFKAQRLGRRWVLAAGTILCIAAFWFLSGFVWTIGISVNGSISQREVLEILRQAGLETGTPVRTVSSMELRNKLITMDDRLYYLSVNMLGTHAQVEVWERGESPQVIPQDVPCDVVSDKTGVIIAVRVREGSARVRVGETIADGDLIASGSMVSTQGYAWQVHADADVDLRVWYNQRLRLPKEAKRIVETGEVTVRKYLVVGDRRIKLYLIETEPYACYYKRVDRSSLTLNADFRFPIMLVTEVYVEIETADSAVDEAKAAQLLEKRMKETMALQKPESKLVSARFEMNEVNGAWQGVLQAECIETAGVQREIVK